MKTIVITGATSGIGKALVEFFAKDNRVFAGYRNEKHIDALKKIGAIPFFIDMTVRESIDNASEFIKSQTNNIDTLINVAGCVVAGVVETLEVDRIRHQFEVNTFSHIEFTQKLLDLLNGGKIINISSMASFGVFPFVGPYCASKRALDILFTSFYNETKRDVKVVSVKPGVIATPLWEKSIDINKNSIDNCIGFEKEMNFMVCNAKKNQVKGLAVEKVVELISRINDMNNPKASYTIGFDAKIAELISHLPQDLINKLVRFNLKRRIRR